MRSRADPRPGHPGRAHAVFHLRIDVRATEIGKRNEVIIEFDEPICVREREATDFGLSLSAYRWLRARKLRERQRMIATSKPGKWFDRIERHAVVVKLMLEALLALAFIILALLGFKVSFSF